MNTENIVLHVDDDQAMLDIVRFTLQKRGYNVISVLDSTTALKTLAECAARVVILDIDMPGKDGVTLLREIKQRDAGIQAIMLTGMVSMGTILHATGLGAQECVFKPVREMNEIADSVDRCFANIERWWSALREWMERRNETQVKQGEEPSTKEFAVSTIEFARV